MATLPTVSRDGQYRLTVRVEHRLTREQLISAAMVCAADADVPEDYARRRAADIRADVVDLLRRRGTDLGLNDGLGDDVMRYYVIGETAIERAFAAFPPQGYDTLAGAGAPYDAKVPEFVWPPRDDDGRPEAQYDGPDGPPVEALDLVEPEPVEGG